MMGYILLCQGPLVVHYFLQCIMGYFECADPHLTSLTPLKHGFHTIEGQAHRGTVLDKVLERVKFKGRDLVTHHLESYCCLMDVAICFVAHFHFIFNLDLKVKARVIEGK